MRRALCIWLPNWPVQRILVAQPQLKFRPVVLYRRDARRGQLVCYCSSAAFKLGIQPPMPAVEAESILDRSAGKQWLIAEHEAAKDLETLEHLALRCEQFSSLVGIEGTHAAEKRAAKKSHYQPSSILMDVGNTAALLGGEQSLSQRIVRAFKQRDYLVRIGLADTLGAAWALAHCESADSPHHLRIPHIEIAQPATHLECIEPLPIESLRLPEETVGLLHQLGVTRVKQLLELPRSGLRARFGEAVLRRLDQASGAVDEVVQTFRPVAPLEVTYALEHSTSRRDTIEQLILRLLTDLAVRLKEQNRGVMQLECELMSAERRTVTIQVGLFRPSVDVQHLFELTRMQLEQKTVTAPIQELVVRATLTSRMMDAQYSLLEQVDSQTPEQLAHLVERLSSRLGRDRVVTTRLLAEPQPECNYRYEPLAGERSRDSGGTSAAQSKNAQTAGLRPLRLYPQPIPLRTIELASDKQSRQQEGHRSWVVHPAAFQHRGHHHQVLNAWGPERIETGWWRGPTVRRDYYRVEDEAGCRYWIFRDLEQGQWFLHGFFE